MPTYAGWAAFNQHAAYLRDLFSSNPPESVARRTWRAVFYVGDEMVSAKIVQVLRIVPGMDPETPRLNVSVSRCFRFTPYATSYLTPPLRGDLEAEDIAVFLGLDEIEDYIYWRDVTQYPNTALVNPVGDG